MHLEVSNAFANPVHARWLRTKSNGSVVHDEIRGIIPSFMHFLHTFGWAALSSQNLYSPDLEGPVSFIHNPLTSLGYRTLINPVVRYLTEAEHASVEGCGSLRGPLFAVPRPGFVTIEAYVLETGEQLRHMEFFDKNLLYLAHEMDHLDAKIIADDGIVVGFSYADRSGYAARLDDLVRNVVESHKFILSKGRLYMIDEQRERLPLVELRLVDAEVMEWEVHLNGCDDRSTVSYGKPIEVRLPLTIEILDSLTTEYAVNQRNIKKYGMALGDEFFSLPLKFCKECIPIAQSLIYP